MDTLISYEKEVRINGKIMDTEGYLYLSPYAPLFEFNEGEEVSFTFTFPVEIVKVFFQNQEGQMVPIQSDEKISFEKMSYAPGNYPFEVYYRGNKSTYSFQVQPSQLDMERIRIMRETVNSYCRGASLNQYASQELKESVLDEVSALLEILPKVIQMANTYMKKMYVEVHKQPKLSHSSKRLSKKSMEWLAKKGLGKSGTLDTMLVEKAEFELDNDQNRLFKQNVLYWMDLIDKQIQKLQTTYDDITQDMIQKESILSTIRSQEGILETSSSINEYVKKKAQKQLIYVSEDMVQKERLLIRNKDILDTLFRYKSILERMIVHSWLKDVSLSSKNRIVAHIDQLRVLLECKKQYELSLSEKRQKMTFLEKSTYKLFETYIYVLLLQLLNEQGFSIVESGVLAYDLSNESVIVLKKGSLYCRIQYDIELEKVKKAVEHSYCTINSTHNRPDFILSFYTNENEPLQTMIVECKWMNEGNIYNAKAETDTEITLMDYYQLAYKSDRVQRGVVDRVICLFPDVEESKISIFDKQILGIGLLPQKNLQNSNGIQCLKKQIKKALKEIE
ncbi:MAG: hypothetical protein Q4C49_05350 [Bacillota bacterium]|nr:hypothetical protein [Bacillota bacterium]